MRTSDFASLGVGVAASGVCDSVQWIWPVFSYCSGAPSEFSRRVGCQLFNLNSCVRALASPPALCWPRRARSRHLTEPHQRPSREWVSMNPQQRSERQRVLARAAAVAAEAAEYAAKLWRGVEDSVISDGPWTGPRGFH